MQKIKIAGFSIIRNAIKYDYPIVEALRSILPICDVVFVGVGESEDGTRTLIEGISPKIQIIDTLWDDTKREGGRVLAEETDKIFQRIPSEYDWCIYIQGDEILHEEGHSNLLKAMNQYHLTKEVQGLLLIYRHFYGSYDYVATSPKWYRHEIRVIKNIKNIFSYKDAQGFRIEPNKKLNVKAVEAHIHHYGWVKPPHIMQDKIKNFHKYWHDDEWIKSNVADSVEFDYGDVDLLEKYEGNHPSVITERIQKTNWQFTTDLSINKMSFKNKIRHKIKKYTGYLPGEYKNYKII